MSVFDKRVSYKPFEYPEVLQFVDAINKTFWVHSEVDFTADIQDFHSNLTHAERMAIKKSLLAIAQIEVAVKTFWGNLYIIFPSQSLTDWVPLLPNANSSIPKLTQDCWKCWDIPKNLKN